MAAMVDTGLQFDETALGLLRGCIGQTLYGYCAYTPFDERNIYARARLDFGSFELDISNRHESVVLGPEYAEEEFAVLRVGPAEGELPWHPADRQLTNAELDFTVDDVLVVVDTMLLTKGSRRLNKLKLVQAVVFETAREGGAELLAFDRDIWSDEYLNVQRGRKVSEVTRDHRADYVAEPPHTYKFARDILRLSQPH